MLTWLLKMREIIFNQPAPVILSLTLSFPTLYTPNIEVYYRGPYTSGAYILDLRKDSPARLSRLEF